MTSRKLMGLFEVLIELFQKHGPITKIVYYNYNCYNNDDLYGQLYINQFLKIVVTKYIVQKNHFL